MKLTKIASFIVVIIFGFLLWYLPHVSRNNEASKEATDGPFISLDEYVPPEPLYNDENFFSTYENKEYGFSIKFPVNYPLSLNEGDQMSCLFIEKVDEKGIPHAKSEAVDIPKGANYPVTFTQNDPDKENPDIVFSGNIGYKLLPKCITNPLVFVSIKKKPAGMTTDEFLAKEVKDLQDQSMDSAAGLYASLTHVELNGKSIPVVRSIEGSVTQNTRDIYYFEKGDYMYGLDYGYSMLIFNDPEFKARNPGEAATTAFSQSVISGFSFINQTGSGVIGNVINNSRGGAVVRDENGNWIGPEPKENPFASFEMKIVNDSTHAEKIVTADAAGKFKVELAPGKYTISKGDKYSGGLRNDQYHVEVKKGQFTTIEMKFGYDYP